ncbi:MAG: L-ascorbate metabolism protein UlaG (beta-lactamase superfamily) [Arenicella sp.]|jgi:L-ascorbate metabolism protein UlaG (beta-lactamase superfamily)
MKFCLLILFCSLLTQVTLSKAGYREEPNECTEKSDALKITFMGNTTLIFEDGLSTFVLDGFVSWPTKRQLVLRTKAKSRVEDVFACLGIDTIDMITALHTHYDHALDVPEIMHQFKPALIGSSSLQNLACRANNQAQCYEQAAITTGKTGCFDIELEPASHSQPKDWLRRFMQSFAAPLKGSIGHEIDHPRKGKSPRLPTTGFRWSKHWVQGRSHNVTVRHGDDVIYVYGGQPNDENNELLSQANVIFVAVAAYPVETPDSETNQAFWQALNHSFSESPGEVKLIIPVHWDDFTKPIPQDFKSKPLKKLRGLGTRRVNAARQALSDDVKAQNIQHGKKRFIYHELKTFAEQFNPSNLFLKHSGQSDLDN